LSVVLPPPPLSTLFPYTTLFRSQGTDTCRSTDLVRAHRHHIGCAGREFEPQLAEGLHGVDEQIVRAGADQHLDAIDGLDHAGLRSEEHTSELQSRENLVCRLLLE